MNGVKALRLAAAAAIALIAGIIIISQVSAQLPTVKATSATINPSATGSVELQAVDIGSPGLGAWEIGITYDSSLLTAVSCDGSQGSVCNTNFASNRVQIAGANAGGLEGTTVLASITFRCNREGSSELSIVLDEFADATTGGPRPIGPGINAGRITCEDSAGLPSVPTSRPAEDDDDDDAPISGLPSSGAGSSSSSSVNWLIAALAALGLVTVTALGASRLFAQHADNGN